MIDVKNTILHTLTNKFDRLRFLGDNDTKVFKKIMQLVVLDELYDWADYLNDSQAVQKKLQQLRLLFIQCNPEFEICRTPFDRHYVNVNTEQTDYTWKRVWDAYGAIDDIDHISPIPETQPSEECGEPTVVFFTGDLPEPETLTDCDKMNIRVNKITGEAFFLDTTSTPNEWKRINSGDSAPVDIPTYELSYTNDGNKLNITIDNTKTPEVEMAESITMATTDNTDLNDIL